MTDALVPWLQSHFNNVADVRRASTQPDPSVIFKNHQADLVVSTWMGARLYLYVLEQPPKVRAIKQILKENGRGGIGTLFLVDATLLPAQNTTASLADWQEALMILNEDFVYAYTMQQGSPSIIQVHYTTTTTRDEFRVWYFDDFEIQNVSVRKRDVQGNIRGTWFVGDIASSAYKRRMNHERVSQRYHYSTKYTQEIPGRNGYAPNHANQKELLGCYQKLGLGYGASEDQVKSAFRRLAMQVHPDVSALPGHEANRRFQEIHEAYEFIKDHHGWS